MESLVTTPEVMLLPQINLLSSSKHKKAVQKRSFDVLIATYKQLYEVVYDSSNEYEDREKILSKTPDEIVQLLK